MSFRRAVAACASLLASSIVAPASAHPLVDQGRARYGQADLTGALEAFERAEAADDLTREELLLLLETRVLVHRALGNEEAAARDLRRLASAAPDYALSSEAPPEMARELERLRASSGGPIAVEVDARADGDGTTLTARIERDPEELVRRVRLHHRTGGGGWATMIGQEARVPADGLVEHWAEAIGPGGAVLATDGSAESPRRFDPDASTVSILATGDANEASDGGVPAWVWIGAGAVVLGVGVLAIVLLASGGGPSDQTQPAYPQVAF